MSGRARVGTVATNLEAIWDMSVETTGAAQGIAQSAGLSLRRLPPPGRSCAKESPAADGPQTRTAGEIAPMATNDDMLREREQT